MVVDVGGQVNIAQCAPHHLAYHGAVKLHVPGIEVDTAGKLARPFIKAARQIIFGHLGVIERVGVNARGDQRTGRRHNVGLAPGAQVNCAQLVEVLVHRNGSKLKDLIIALLNTAFLNHARGLGVEKDEYTSHPPSLF